MFALVQVGANQFKVSEGDIINVFELGDKEGASINLEKVLMYVNGTDVRIGQPFLKDVKVAAKILNHKNGEKMVAFKFRRRKHYARTVGYRQKLSTLSITKISA